MKTLQLIQLLRFVAAFLVVLSHSAYLLGLHQSVSAQLSYAFAFGNVGVHIFFVISGFIMVFTTFGPRAKQIGPTEFLRRRFVRIYPIYWIYAGLTLSIMAQKLSGYEIAAAAVLWPPYSSTIIGQGWTLTYEVAFYLCFAAIIPMGMLRGLSALTITFVILVALHPRSQPST